MAKANNLMIVALLAGGYYLLSKLGNNDPIKPDDVSENPNQQDVNTDVANGYPIVYNVKNTNAIPIQKALGFTGDDVDGIIGPNTLSKLKVYWPQVTTRFRIANKAQLQWVLNKISGKQPAVLTRADQLFNSAKNGKNLVFVQNAKSDTGTISNNQFSKVGTMYSKTNDVIFYPSVYGRTNDYIIWINSNGKFVKTHQSALSVI